jgi:hypothetical protein
LSSKPCMNATELLRAINLGNVRDEVEHTTAVTPLVVVPADKLNKLVVESNTCLGVEDRRVGVAVEVAGDDLVLSVGENAYLFCQYSLTKHMQSWNLPLRSPSAACLMVALMSS